MKRFVNRLKEKEFLQREYNKSESSLVVIYGRRRIGKTALISEFIKDKDALFFLATEETENENRTAFTRLAADYINSKILASAKFDDWNDIFECIANYRPDKRKLIVIDEFQYIGKSNPSFISKLQKIWDTVLKPANVMLVLCGSLIHMMYDQTLAYDSPLYGRRTGQIKLKQIAFRYYSEFFDDKNEKNLIERYSVTGGVPKYIESFEPYEDIYEAIERCVLSKENYLYEEPSFLLDKEVQNVGSYFSIIKTIASGKHKLNEISSILEIKSTSLPKYLNVLIDLDILEREVPITEVNPEKSKMGLYKIKDNYIEFWFKFIYPNKSFIETDHTDYVMKKIREGFITNQVAFVYEDICRNEYMWELAAQNEWNFVPDKIGRWWDRKDTEIDIVAFDSNGNNIIFGECKYTNKPLGIEVYNNLLAKKDKVNWKNTDRNEYYIFFSINGYTEEMKKLASEKQNIKLY